jgi:nicotinamidase-related amidase
MSLTQLDPRTALILIDLQKGILGFLPEDVSAEIVGNAARLAAAFRRKNLPVVLVNVNAVPPGRTEIGRKLGALPPEFTEFAPELDRQKGDIVVTKRTAGAFMHTGLAEILRERGVTQLVICGISTSAGVESTARQAYELGFNVTVATDTVADTDPDSHHHSISRIFPKIGETGGQAEIIALL